MGVLGEGLSWEERMKGGRGEQLSIGGMEYEVQQGTEETVRGVRGIEMSRGMGMGGTHW